MPRDVRVTGVPVAASVPTTQAPNLPLSGVVGSPVTFTTALPPAGTVTESLSSENGPLPWIARFSVTSALPELVSVRSFANGTSCGPCGQAYMPHDSDPVACTVLRTAAATSTRPVPTSNGVY